jgi:hypothetical protein
MITRRNLLVLVLAFVVLAAVPAVRAEVAAEVDDYGNYIKTTVLANASVKNLKIWTVQRQKKTIIPLNPEGDLRGDMWPYIVENPLDNNHPWAVWSTFNGNDYDLAWSRFLPVEWTPTESVMSRYSPQDDLDPTMDLDLNDGGRPYIAWWRDNGGTGEVYMSIFLRSVWMSPFLVSDLGTDSRYPSVKILDDGKIEITFETAEGPETRIVVFNHPSTITDDLDPLEHVFLTPTEEPGNINDH